MVWQIGRTTVHIGVWFWVSLSLLLIFDRSGTGALSLAAILIHECGHLAVMALMRAPPRRVSFRAFGILLDTDRLRSLSYRQEALVLLAGPAANLLTAALALLCGGKALWFAAVNLIIGLFHLLPFAALDGGSLLALLLRRQSPSGRGERIADLVSLLLLIPVFLLSILLCLSGKVNFSLPLILSVAILGSIQKTTA